MACTRSGHAASKFHASDRITAWLMVKVGHAQNVRPAWCWVSVIRISPVMKAAMHALIKLMKQDGLALAFKFDCEVVECV